MCGEKAKYRRMQLLNEKGVPTQTEVRDQLGSPLAEVFFDSLDERCQELMGLTPELEGVQPPLWVSPSDILKGIVRLTPPLTSRHIRAESHRAILDLGEDCVTKLLNQMRAEIVNIITDVQKLMRWKANEMVADAIKQVQEAEKKACDESKKLLFEKIAQQLEYEKEGLSQILQSDIETRIQKERKEVHLLMDDQLKMALEENSEENRKKCKDKLAQSLHKQKSEFQEFLDKLTEEVRKTLENLDRKHASDLGGLRSQLESENRSDVVSLITRERQKCKELLTEEREKCKEKLSELEIFIDKLLSDMEEIDKLYRGELSDTEEREGLLHHIIKEFQRFINYVIGAKPGQADFLLSHDKLDMLERKLRGEEPFLPMEMLEDAVTAALKEAREPVAAPLGIVPKGMWPDLRTGKPSMQWPLPAGHPRHWPGTDELGKPSEEKEADLGQVATTAESTLEDLMEAVRLRCESYEFLDQGLSQTPYTVRPHFDGLEKKKLASYLEDREETKGDGPGIGEDEDKSKDEGEDRTGDTGKRKSKDDTDDRGIRRSKDDTYDRETRTSKDDTYGRHTRRSKDDTYNRDARRSKDDTYDRDARRSKDDTYDRDARRSKDDTYGRDARRSKDDTYGRDARRSKDDTYGRDARRSKDDTYDRDARKSKDEGAGKEFGFEDGRQSGLLDTITGDAAFRDDCEEPDPFRHTKPGTRVGTPYMTRGQRERRYPGLQGAGAGRGLGWPGELYSYGAAGQPGQFGVPGGPVATGAAGQPGQFGMRGGPLAPGALGFPGMSHPQSMFGYPGKPAAGILRQQFVCPREPICGKEKLVAEGLMAPPSHFWESLEQPTEEFRGPEPSQPIRSSISISSLSEHELLGLLDQCGYRIAPPHEERPQEIVQDLMESLKQQQLLAGEEERRQMREQPKGPSGAAAVCQQADDRVMRLLRDLSKHPSLSRLFSGDHL